MLNSKRIIIMCCLFFASFIAVQAQTAKITADKVLAIVGDRIILQSDITNSILDMQRRGGGPLPDSAACMIAQQAIVSKVLMLQAEKDSLPVTDDDVEADLDQRVRTFLRQVGTVEELERLAGKSVFQIKEDARESVKENKLAEAMQRKIVENVHITPYEVKEYFEKIPKDSLPYYESELEVGQIILYPKASRDLEQYIIDELNTYKKQIEKGVTNFGDLAKKVTDDPGSKELGGLYEINRNDKSFDPIFMSTALRLKEGQISSPVKSKFGYHIIYLQQKNGDNLIVRHILKIPPITDDEIKQVISRMDTIRSKIISDVMLFNVAAAKYSEDEMQKFAGPFTLGRDGSTYVTIDELDKEMVLTLSSMKVGNISAPTAFTSDQGKKGVRIVYLKSRSAPHRMNIRDDYSKISQYALEEKKSKVIDKWMAAKIPAYYIMVDNNSAQQCPQLSRYSTTNSKGF